jgi:hypothetical protein
MASDRPAKLYIANVASQTFRRTHDWGLPHRCVRNFIGHALLAPFVGTAVGFALARGPPEIFAIFLCLGLGMALPYWMTALFPGFVRWLRVPARGCLLCGNSSASCCSRRPFG